MEKKDQQQILMSNQEWINNLKSNQVQNPEIELISSVFSMDKKISEFNNPKIKKALEEFKQLAPAFRKIRNDGNCFYRTMIFYFLETILSNNQQREEELRRLISSLENKNFL